MIAQQWNEGPIDREGLQLVGVPTATSPLDFAGGELAYQNNSEEKRFRTYFNAETYRSLSLTLTTGIFLEGVSFYGKP